MIAQIYAWWIREKNKIKAKTISDISNQVKEAKTKEERRIAARKLYDALK